MCSKRKGYTMFLLLFVPILMIVGQASAITLPPPTLTIDGVPVALPYGDAYSYSLPILAHFYDQANGGGVGPGNPFYVTSTPGAIQDDIVVATGASGNPVNTNFPNMDNAYSTPSGVSGSPLFSTRFKPDYPEPPPAFAGDTNLTWDAQIGALQTYLGGQDLVFFFNNNQENSGAASNQNLFVWAQVAVVDLQGVLLTQYFDLTNNNIGPLVYTSPGAATGEFPYPGGGTWPGASDFILSGGQVVLPDGTIINHNLGANQAAYAVFSPELNGLVQNPGGYDVIQLDLRMFALNNGYEQVFIQRATVQEETPIPEPCTMLLLGSGLVGVAGLRRKCKK